MLRTGALPPRLIVLAKASHEAEPNVKGWHMIGGQCSHMAKAIGKGDRLEQSLQTLTESRQVVIALVSFFNKYPCPILRCDDGTFSNQNITTVQ